MQFSIPELCISHARSSMVLYFLTGKGVQPFKGLSCNQKGHSTKPGTWFHSDVDNYFSIRSRLLLSVRRTHSFRSVGERFADLHAGSGHSPNEHQRGWPARRNRAGNLVLSSVRPEMHFGIGFSVVYVKQLLSWAVVLAHFPLYQYIFSAPKETLWLLGGCPGNHLGQHFSIGSL